MTFCNQANAFQLAAMAFCINGLPWKLAGKQNQLMTEEKMLAPPVMQPVANMRKQALTTLCRARLGF